VTTKEAAEEDIDDKDRSSHRPIGGSSNDEGSGESLTAALARRWLENSSE